MTLSSMMIDEMWAEFVATKRVVLRDELILHYMPLVRFVVSRLGIPPTSMLEAEDLVSYGTIGLMNAIDRYDPTRGVRFEAFATARIRGAVIDQLRALNWRPRSAVSRVKQVETALAALEQRLGRQAKEDEAAKELGGRARAALREERAELRATYELRYRGQAFELAIGAGLDPQPEELRSAFEREHEDRYGYSDSEQTLELVTIRVTATVAASITLISSESPPAT